MYREVSGVNVGDWGCIVRDAGTIMVLVLLAQKFHPPKVTDQRLCYCNSDASRQHN